MSFGQVSVRPNVRPRDIYSGLLYPLFIIVSLICFVSSVVDSNIFIKCRTKWFSFVPPADSRNRQNLNASVFFHLLSIYIRFFLPLMNKWFSNENWDSYFLKYLLFIFLENIWITKKIFYFLLDV